MLTVAIAREAHQNFALELLWNPYPYFWTHTGTSEMVLKKKTAIERYRNVDAGEGFVLGKD